MKKLLGILSVISLTTTGFSISPLTEKAEKTKNLNEINNFNNDVFSKKNKLSINAENKSQPTIYISNETWNQVTTFEHDLTNINALEVKQIGYFSNDFGEIQAVRMPQIVQKVPNELPKEITSIAGMFWNSKYFNQDISFWDTSNITDMSGLFANSISFNQDISSWDTSNVKDMDTMFVSAQNFNQDISSWDTSNVITMEGMFANTIKFNQNISIWNVKKVRNYKQFDANSNQMWVLAKKPHFE